MLKTSPAVFAVGNQYQIMVETTSECLMSVKIGENTYEIDLKQKRKPKK